MVSFLIAGGRFGLFLVFIATLVLRAQWGIWHGDGSCRVSRGHFEVVVARLSVVWGHSSCVLGGGDRVAGLAWFDCESKQYMVGWGAGAASGQSTDFPVCCGGSGLPAGLRVR